MCSGQIGVADSVAVVQLHGGSWVIRDYADPAHPRTVCKLPYPVQLIDARHVLVGGSDYLYGVLQIPEMTVTWFQLPRSDNTQLVGVSPNLDEIVYLAFDSTTNVDRVHVVTAAGDAIAASVPAIYGRCGSPEDSRLGGFSPSSRYSYVLDQSVPNLASLLVLRMNVAVFQIVPQGQWARDEEPMMAVWSPTTETLYYRLKNDVWKWTPTGGSERFLPGVAWSYATISPDGTYLAYAAALRPDGLHNVYLVDLRHGSAPQAIGKGARTTPAFLNATQLWYRSDVQGPCGAGGDVPMVYDLGDGSESASIIDNVASVWPSTSSNF